VTARWTAAIVEDEGEARLNLVAALAPVDWVEVVAEARDGIEAVEVIDRLRPDLVFLDVQLPELSGLDVLQRIRHAPVVIFTTAYDQHALAAFELGALDYLLKPFGAERLRRTLERARRFLAPEAGGPAAGERARSVLGPEPLERLFARRRDRIVPIPVADIRRIDAQGDYAAVHAEAGVFLLHVSLGELEARLDGRRFLRVHRSHIVNLDAVRHLQAYDERRLVVVLADGSEVVASRAASERIRRLAR
jgi:two-component system LytT family response regulator